MANQALAVVKDQRNSDGREVHRGISNKKFYELIDESLLDRNQFEIRLANYNFQRFARDRPKVNNKPWPGGSNYTRKKIDESIEQKKAFYSQIIHSSQFIANFKALIPGNNNFSGLAEAYFDFVIKEQTEFERESIYTLDSGLESGFGFLKIFWNEDEQRAEFKWIDNLYLIFPSKTLHLEDAPWLAHVVQMSKDEALDKYGKIAGFKELLKRATGTEESTRTNDVGDVDNDRYERKGINLSMSNRFVVWEIHYKDPNDPSKVRMRTICPDDPDFDFKDDKQYLYPAEKKQEYMFKQFRREWLTPDLYSSRGVAELTWEEQLMLTHLARLKHNYMSFVVNPAFTAPNGLTTTNTNNIHFGPGYVLPGDLQPIQFPPPPISMDQEMQNVESIVDRRLNTANSSPSAPNTIFNGGEGNKTAREISYKASLQTLATNYETMSWKKFLRESLRYAWMLIVENKPETLRAYVKGTIQEIPPEALNHDYNIVLSWSVDNINKEFNIQQAAGLWQQSINNPMANMLEAWKNLMEQIAPGQSERFVSETAELQIQMQKQQAVMQYQQMIAQQQQAQAQEQQKNQQNLETLRNQIVGMQAQQMNGGGQNQQESNLQTLRNQIAGAQAQQEANQAEGVI